MTLGYKKLPNFPTSTWQAINKFVLRGVPYVWPERGLLKREFETFTVKKKFPDEYSKELLGFLPEIEPLVRGAVTIRSGRQDKQWAVHIDRSRRLVINVPVQIDNDASTAYVGKYADPEMYKRRFVPATTTSDASSIFHFEPEKYDSYKLTCPTILDTTRPHTWSNQSDTPRIICSITLDLDLSMDDALDTVIGDWA